MRQFIRHPTDIPIDISSTGQFMCPNLRARNVSLGGVSLRAATPIEPGAIVMISISLVKPSFESKAHVVWCAPSGSEYDIGVEFLNSDDAFRARMVEQVCYIEHYRREIARSEGRELGAAEAAQEWISKYASHFPFSGPEGLAEGKSDQ